MKKSKYVFIIAFLIFIIVILFLIFSDFFAGYKWKTVYIANFTNNEIQELFCASSRSLCYNWSGDSKYIACYEDNLDWKGHTLNERVRLFKIEELKEISIPGEINNMKGKPYKYRDISWINNSLLKIVRSNYDYSEEDETVIFDVNNNSISYGKSNKKVAVRHGFPYFRIDLSENIIKEKIGFVYSEGILSRDKSRFFYGTKDHEVFLYNINSNEKIKLFDGFALYLSPGESKIQYCLHKDRDIKDIDLEENFFGNELETYVFDLNTGTSLKIADFFVRSYFSPNDNYLVF